VIGNLEMALLTRVIDDKDFATLDKAKIDQDFFTTPVAKEVYEFLRAHYNNPLTAGLVPSREFIHERYPAFYFAPSTDPVPTLTQAFKIERIRLEIQMLAQDLSTKAEIDPLEALATLRANASSLSSLAETSQDFSMARASAMLRNRYEMVAAAGGVLGIPFPWGPLNEATKGIQRSQFLVFYGRPKSMKTWIGLEIALFAYLNARRRVLVYSREMPPELLLQRAASIIAKVDYEKWSSGRLQPEQRDRVFRILDELADDEVYAGARGARQPYFIVSSDRGSDNGGGVAWLRAKITELDPDLVIVDGMYLMKDDRTRTRTIDWKNITHISQDMKSSCNDFGVPIIGITQANRGAEKTMGDDLTELAFADAIGMDADGVFRVTRRRVLDQQTKKKITELIITAPGLREGLFEGIVINGNPGYDFSYIRTLVAQDDPDASGGPDASGVNSTVPTDRSPARLRQRSPFLKDGRFRDPVIPR
jgi:replicative DNA helicase